MPTTTFCGIGACAATVLSTCTNGIEDFGICVPGQSKIETCNNADDDCDGYIDNEVCDDKYCTGAIPNPDTMKLGLNRWIWNGENWETKVSKNIATGNFSPDLDYTWGCSCTQILNSMSGTLKIDFSGHYKSGCAKSILQDWHRGTYDMSYWLDGVFVEKWIPLW